MFSVIVSPFHRHPFFYRRVRQRHDYTRENKNFQPNNPHIILVRKYQRNKEDKETRVMGKARNKGKKIKLHTSHKNLFTANKNSTENFVSPI